MNRFYGWRWRISSKVNEPYEERRTSSFNKDEEKNCFHGLQTKRITLKINILCLDENEGIHLYVHVGFLFVW